MKTKNELLRRACRWVIPVHGSSVLFILATRDNSSDIWAMMPLYQVLLFLNLAGWLVARGLGVLAQDGFNPTPDPHPIAGRFVMFGGSTLFRVLVVWWFLWARRRP